MSDTAQTPEAVAYSLYREIKTVYNIDELGGPEEKKAWALDTYAECLEAVQGPGNRR